jgi:hypothetical protein
MALMMLVMAGVLSLHLFGLRMFQLTKAKLGASDGARKALDRLSVEVRAAKLVKIGMGDLTTFTEAADTTEQQGNAIQIYPTLETSQFVRYYLDSADQKLKRVTSGALEATVIAEGITNSVVFTSEDYSGTVLTDNDNNRVIGLTLQFYQIAYPVVNIGPGNYFDFYQLRGRITRRALE